MITMSSLDSWCVQIGEEWQAWLVFRELSSMLQTLESIRTLFVFVDINGHLHVSSSVPEYVSSPCLVVHAGSALSGAVGCSASSVSSHTKLCYFCKSKPIVLTNLTEVPIHVLTGPGTHRSASECSCETSVVWWWAFQGTLPLEIHKFCYQE
jgi:hypothetical protein